MATRGLLPILGQPDPRVAKDVHLVGRYALGVTWADDHGSIYPFAQLRLDDPGGPGAPSEDAAWPRDIKKLPDVLRVTWADGHESRYPWGALRDLCRCAGCTGGH